jgi:hypothetical protein
VPAHGTGFRGDGETPRLIADTTSASTPHWRCGCGLRAVAHPSASPGTRSADDYQKLGTKGHTARSVLQHWAPGPSSQPVLYRGATVRTSQPVLYCGATARTSRPVLARAGAHAVHVREHCIEAPVFSRACPRDCKPLPRGQALPCLLEIFPSTCGISLCVITIEIAVHRRVVVNQENTLRKRRM